MKNEFKYMFLDRLKSDCEYFLNFGNRNIKHLYYQNINQQISKMKKIWLQLPTGEKPEWLKYSDILRYEKNMTALI